MRFYLLVASLSAVLCWGCNRGAEPSLGEKQPADAPAPVVLAKPIVPDKAETPSIAPDTEPAAAEKKAAASDDKKSPAAEEKKLPPPEMERPTLPPLFRSTEPAPAQPEESKKAEVKKEEPPLAAPMPADNTAAAEPSKPELSVAVQDNGEPALVVKFPWKEFARPSLQMTLVGDAPATPMVVDGPQLTDVFGKMVSKLNKPVHPGATQVLERAVWFADHDNGKTLRIFGATNALKRAAAFGLDDQDQVALIFYLLDSWADPDGALRFAYSDLQAIPRYAEPGKLQVWFLNEEKVVWSQAIAWPGKAKAQAPATSTPGLPSPEKPADDKKPAAGEQKPGGFDPFWRGPAKSAKPEPSEVVAPPPVAPVITPPTTVDKPATTETKPAVVEPPKEKPKPAKTDIHDMTVEEAAQYIDKKWSKTMSPRVLKIWRGALANYFQVDNPEAVRMDVFQTLIKNCYEEQPSGELRNAFALLYQKVKQRMSQK